MSLATTLQLVAGLCFAILTIGSPFMRSDSRGHKIWHTLIGIAGICALITSSVLNGQTQKEYAKSFDRLAVNIQKLAEPAQAENGSSVDQILAAAASKLIKQDTEIKHLKSDVQSVTHPSNGFYRGDAMVAIAQGNAAVSGNQITFQLVVAGGDGLDFNQVYTFRNADLKCERPSTYGETGNFGVLKTQYPRLQCTILGKRPSD